MPLSIHHKIALSFTLFIPGFVSAIDLPTTVQLDLIFPRNNTVYKPTYPFPVVFALHNGSAAWPFVVHWKWDIMNLRNGTPSDVLSSGGYTPGLLGQEKPPSPPDMYLDIAADSQIFNTSERTLFLRYSFGIRYSCDKTTGEIPINRALDVSFDDIISFHLDRENGQMPNVTAEGNCAIPVGSIGIDDKFDPPHGWLMKGCPVLARGPQPTQACALNVNETVAENVKTAMLVEAACLGQNWPNVTGLTEKCTVEESAAAKVVGNLQLTIAIVVVMFVTMRTVV